jgi:N-acetylmuramic acid 6-phosphate etherase
MLSDAEVVLSSLDTEKGNPATADIDRRSPLEIVRLINAEDARVALAVEQELSQIARAIEEIAARLRQGGRLIYIGAGTSGRLGVLDASECPPTFNTPPDMVIGWIAGGPDASSKPIENIEDDAVAGRNDVIKLNVSEKDALVGIAASGRTPYVLSAVACARERAALTIGLACNKNTPLEQEVEIMVAPLVGPEVISGSTRLKAGTAQKMVLNMLSTGTMILLGKTFGNLMVDVQATNHKLRKRALSIVRQVTNLDEPAAEAILQASDGEAKTAIVAACHDVTPELARELLLAHNGNLRATLDDIS